MSRLQKHIRKALKQGRQIAQAKGFELVLGGMDGTTHYRFVVLQGDKEVGHYALSSTPKCEGDTHNLNRQCLQRVLRSAGA
jgi:hypothetical protein